MISWQQDFIQWQCDSCRDTTEEINERETFGEGKEERRTSVCVCVCACPSIRECVPILVRSMLLPTIRARPTHCELSTYKWRKLLCTMGARMVDKDRIERL
eukprot:1143273-Pelagomonas_calceolata.AAC.1